MGKMIKRLLQLALVALLAIPAWTQVMQNAIVNTRIETIGTPTDSPGAGTYGSTQSVTLSDASAGFILYTVDGSTPACPSTGTLYTGAFNISVTTTLKAIGCLGGNGGGVRTSVYTISAVSIVHTGGAWHQCTSCTTNNGSTTGNTAAGATVFVIMSYPDTRSITAISDAAGDAFDITTACTNSANVKCKIFEADPGGYKLAGYCFPSSAGSAANVITATLGGSAAYFTVMPSAYTGATCKLDTGSVPSGSGSGTGLTLALGTALNTSGAGMLLITYGVSNSYSLAAKSPWAEASGTVSSGDGSDYLIGSGGAENNAIFTNGGSGTWAVYGYAFQHQ